LRHRATFRRCSGRGESQLVLRRRAAPKCRSAQPAAGVPLERDEGALSPLRIDVGDELASISVG
jgi:hypothetical protein